MELTVTRPKGVGEKDFLRALAFYMSKGKSLEFNSHGGASSAGVKSLYVSGVSGNATLREGPGGFYIDRVVFPSAPDRLRETAADFQAALPRLAFNRLPKGGREQVAALRSALGDLFRHTPRERHHDNFSCPSCKFLESSADGCDYYLHGTDLFVVVSPGDHGPVQRASFSLGGFAPQLEETRTALASLPTYALARPVASMTLANSEECFRGALLAAYSFLLAGKAWTFDLRFSHSSQHYISIGDWRLLADGTPGEAYLTQFAYAGAGDVDVEDTVRKLIYLRGLLPEGEDPVAAVYRDHAKALVDRLIAVGDATADAYINDLLRLPR